MSDGAAAPEPPTHARVEGGRLNASKGKEIVSSGRIGGEYVRTENPEFLARRLALYDRFKALQDQALAEKEREPIKITLPDGTVKEATAWETSPLDIAKGISQGLADRVLVARVRYSRRCGSATAIADASGFEEEGDDGPSVDKGELWDLTRPLEGDCKLELLKFDDKDAKMVFWHSSAHILGECLESKLGTSLTIGPPVDPGFYYDSYMGDEGATKEIISMLQKECGSVAKKKQKFERLVITKDQALELFADNPFKMSILKNKVKDGAMTTAYRCGTLIDLCMGPHIPHTGKVKAIEITKQSSAYWLGEADNDTLQRIYGISFPDKKMLKEYKLFMKQAEERDHRRKGIEQELFFFHPLSPGSAFFLPHGARIYSNLMSFIRREYRVRGYEEVVTPNVFNSDLWRTSGHWQHYAENMFQFTDGEKNEKKEEIVYALKPMNCPAHCLLFSHRLRSYRELPLRLADFGVLHRNELSGALSGLTRVRRFVQDDGHVFCRGDQVEAEVMAALEFMKFVYDVFGMSFNLERSTRPKKACGLETKEGVALWDKAEAALASALDKFIGKGNWRDNPGDGAFYGPKIDIKVYDAMKRVHQCATIQLDFQLPIRFDLTYKDDEGGFARPVLVHRAMLGSLERIIAILTEHYGGKWPFWLSPRQAIIVPVHSEQYEYAEKVRRMLHAEGFNVECDASSKTLNNKIRTGQQAQFNFILVVGGEEMANNTVNVRTRANGRPGTFSVEEIISKFTTLAKTYKPDDAL